MRFALLDNKRIIPSPFKKGAVCPRCNEEVIARCGNINVWHWAHKSSKECDQWSEGETAWHLNWKGNFPDDMQEVLIKRGEKKHIADIRNSDGLVFEFQNSTISSEEVEKREKFYENMIWVLNGEKFAKNLFFKNKNDYYTFIWKWMPKTWLGSSKKIIIDIIDTNEMFIIKKLYNKYGWGKFISKKEFIRSVTYGYRID